MAANSRRPHSDRTNFSEVTALGGIAYRLAPVSIRITPLFQCRVVKLAGKAEMIIEAAPLLGSRINSIAIGPTDYQLGVHRSDSAPRSRQLPVNVTRRERQPEA